MDTEGVNIHFVDRERAIESIINTVRDKNKVFIELPRESWGVDGRDLFRKPRKKRK